MNPEQALEFLYRVARLAPVPADVHEQVASAVRALNAVINPPPSPKDVKTDTGSTVQN